MEYIKIGFITKPHGVRGEFKVLPLTEDKKRFKELKKVFIEDKKSYIEEEIQQVKISEDFIIIKLKKYNSCDEADVLRNRYIFVERTDAIPLFPDEYYTQDLEECSFWFEDNLLGNVDAVINEGSCDIFIVKYKGTEVYYPFLKDLIKNIDIENKKIFIKEIEGYFD